MNFHLRLLFLSTLCWASVVFAEGPGPLNKNDFSSATKMKAQVGWIVRARLSDSGMSKFKVWNASSVGKSIGSEIAGVHSEFVLRVPIEGDQLEMGPYPAEDADRVISAINRK